MRLNVGNSFRIDIRYSQSIGHRHRFPLNARGGKTHFGLSIVGHCGALDESMNSIVICQSIGQAFQNNHPNAISWEHPVCLCIKSTAVSVGTPDAAFAVEKPRLLRNNNRDSSSQSYVALRILKRLTGEMDGKQGSRATGL